MGESTHIIKPTNPAPTPPPPPEAPVAPTVQVTPAASASPQSDSFYTQSAGAKNENRTYIPGMKRKSDPQPGESAQATQAQPQSVRIELQTRPLAGVLFSVSRDNCGELFPVYIGRNTIGSKPECDIYLSEQSVSPDHAILLIRKIGLPDGSRKVTMSISDYESEHGTFINDQRLEEDVEPIKGHDVIRIGNAYTFLFVPLDADASGLFTASNFIATPRVENRPTVSNDYLAYMGPMLDDTIYPNAVGEEDEQTFYGRSTKKKEDHSSKKTL